MTQPQLIRADYDNDSHTLTVTTVTLRDFFAAFALAGFVNGPPLHAMEIGELTVHEYRARQSYKAADAMLEVRQQVQVTK